VRFQVFLRRGILRDARVAVADAAAAAVQAVADVAVAVVRVVADVAVVVRVAAVRAVCRRAKREWRGFPEDCVHKAVYIQYDSDPSCIAPERLIVELPVSILHTQQLVLALVLWKCYLECLV